MFQLFFKWERSQLATIHSVAFWLHLFINYAPGQKIYLCMWHSNLLCNQLDFVPRLSVDFMIVIPVIKMEVKDFRIVRVTTFSSIVFNNEFLTIQHKAINMNSRLTLNSCIFTTKSHANSCVSMFPSFQLNMRAKSCYFNISDVEKCIFVQKKNRILQMHEQSTNGRAILHAVKYNNK